MATSKRSGSGKPSNLYQREAGGVWYARVSVNGRSARQSLRTRDRREAERRLKSWLASQSPYHGTTRHTWDEAAALWFAAGQWKPKTTAGYEKLLTGVLRPHFGSLFWDQVDKAELQRFADARRAKGASTATINRALSVMSGIADHVRELDGWPELNPVRQLPKKPRREKRWTFVRPPAADVEAIFARMRGTFGDLCRLALLCGARKDELVFLHRDQAQGGRATFLDTKAKVPRTVPWTLEARAIVDRQPTVRGSPFLFNTRSGGRYQRVTEMWREVVSRAQKLAQREGRRLTPMRFHDLRHEYAIRYLEAGGSLYTLQKLLGHGTISQTERYLAYVTPEQAAAASSGTSQI